MFQDNVQCALEVSRLQLEEWKSHGPQAHEEALTEKALLQEELVTVRARMCDVSLVCKKTKTLILDYNNISSLMLNHQLWVIELILWYFLYIQEIERVWCQYERMESELSVVRSQLQHICNFGMPQVILHYKPNSFCLIRPMASQRNFVKVCTTSIEKFASNLMILMWGVGLKMWNSLIFWCSMWIMSMFYPIRSNLRLRESCGWWRTYSMD